LGANRESDGTARLASLAIRPDGSTQSAFKVHLQHLPETGCLTFITPPLLS
jgi:hypothetical protein